MIIVHPAARAAPAFLKTILKAFSSQLNKTLTYSRNRKIPRHQPNTHPHRLLHGQNPPPTYTRHLNRPRNPLGLPRKPPRKPQRILQLPSRLGQRLPRLIRNNLRNIFQILSDQSIPFKKQLSARFGRGLAVGLECGVGSLNGDVYIFRGVVGGGGPYLTGSWVWRWLIVGEENMVGWESHRLRRSVFQILIRSSRH
jgi:hypothetical protein